MEHTPTVEVTLEIWKSTHHPDYEVSNLGRVRSWAPQGGDVRNGNPTRPSKPRILKPGLTSVGYPSVVLARLGTHLVHRLVAAAFIGPCPAGQETRHKDDDRTNARADNLEYGTRADNVRDMMQRGRHVNYMAVAKRDWHGRIVSRD